MKGNYFDSETPSYNYEVLIFVEGRDDAMFFEKILTELNADSDKVRINVCKGKGNLKPLISLLSKSTEYARIVRSVVVALDSDNGELRAIAEASGALAALGVNVTDGSDITRIGGRSFAIIALPGRGREGDLETLGLDFFPPGEIRSTADELLAAANRTRGPLDKPSKRSVQILLAATSAEIRYSIGWAFWDGTISIDFDEVRHITDILEGVL